MAKLPTPTELSAAPQKKPARQSNIEALRMLAMFLVLVVHAMYFSLGAPTAEETAASPADTGLRMLFQGLSIVSVNVFVLISGWFGIRPKWKGACSFLFQCFFFMAGLTAVTLALSPEPLSLKNAVSACLSLIAMNNGYWFVKAYLLLYILAPALNAFTGHARRTELKLTLLFFFLFQTFYGFALPAPTVYFSKGYSPVSFIGLYLLARYVRLYRPRFSTLPRRTDLCLYLLPALLYAAAGLLRPLSAGLPVISRLYAYGWGNYTLYTNPLVILGALYLLLYFSKLSITSRFVNFCGASCFAVYLLHIHDGLLIPYFKPVCRYLHDNFPLPAYLALTFGFLIAVFLAAILIDQLRLAAWRRLWPWLEPRIPARWRIAGQTS